ncbi:MAG: hypothetical protein ACJ749_20230, partial [Flavisolibacter sp.]
MSRIISVPVFFFFLSTQPIADERKRFDVRKTIYYLILHQVKRLEIERANNRLKGGFFFCKSVVFLM